MSATPTAPSLFVAFGLTGMGVHLASETDTGYPGLDPGNPDPPIRPRLLAAAQLLRQLVRHADLGALAELPEADLTPARNFFRERVAASGPRD